MPELGEIRKGFEIGYKSYLCSHIWAACIDCGKPRWVRLRKGQPQNLSCRACALLHGRKRRGNRYVNYYGYIEVSLSPDDFFYPMAYKQSHYVMEHRLVMAKKLGRLLQPWEQVHHKDGIKDHNTEDNLELTMAGSHSRQHGKGYRDGYLKGLHDGQSQAIKDLKAEVRSLRFELRNMNLTRQA